MDSKKTMNSTENNQSSPTNTPASSMFYQLQIVLIVAFILATLFTAWTPASLLPGNLSERFAEVLAFQATETAAFPTPTARPRPLIGLVVGHWDDNTKDPGAVCTDGLTEIEVNQAIATQVKQILVDQGFDVDLLREFDPQLQGYQALALVSIHADSCDYINDEATGFKVAAALSNQYPERASRLTACIKDRYSKATGLPYHSSTVTNDMSSYHAFDEIDINTNAVIIEVGFLNLDRQILTKGQDRVADGISDGVLCYIRNEDITPTDQP
ncbi:MAG: N-acetylmuramoyl-L-alanine amidase [Chloroflexota bacterium]|nr:MAG: N-acetylmuramoyl-L-alanine amidase [Chloroflexota bacterium]